MAMASSTFQDAGVVNKPSGERKRPERRASTINGVDNK